MAISGLVIQELCGPTSTSALTQRPSPRLFLPSPMRQQVRSSCVTSFLFSTNASPHGPFLHILLTPKFPISYFNLGL